jgi:ribosomal protein S18 acetylase RimI-like enzyme
MTASIRPFQASDWPAVWSILRSAVSKGDTFAYPPEAGEHEIRTLWIRNSRAAFVACDTAARILGSYFIKPNQLGHGSHVCNCGYVVSEEARGKGVASLMCEHSQSTAVDLGFLAMQFNLVVSTNGGAVHLWQKHGFRIVGTLPRAFRHPQAGLVDAYVMYKWLAP